jgi:hypothetical protein
MKKSTIITLALSLLLYLQSFSQTKSLYAFYRMNDDSTAYTGMNQLIDANQKLSYITALPIFTNLRKDDREVKKHDAYLVEIAFALNYTLAQGRNSTSHAKQCNRLSFVYRPVFRMRMVESYPLTPTNQEIGFQHQMILWNSYTRGTRKPCANQVDFDAPYFDDRNWRKLDDKNLSMVYLSTEACHFSNGQKDNHLDSNNRANYVSGNFSTNYIKSVLNFTHYSSKQKGQLIHHDYTLSLGYRRDGTLIDPLSMDKDMYGRYGNDRLVGGFNINWYRVGKKPRYWIEDCEEKKVRSGYAIRLRYEFEEIIDPLRKFNYRSKSRLSSHLFLKYEPLSFRTISYMVHCYLGRDYLNNYYDRIVFAPLMFGLSFNPNKIFPPRITRKNLDF